MKRREFIIKTASTAALGALVTYWPFQNVMALSNKTSFPLQAYDDNKVVRVYDRNVTNYNFSGSPVYWKTINHDVLKSMLLKSLNEISGEKGEVNAWQKILSGQHKTVLSNKKIVIKVNFNNTIRDTNTTLNNSPAMIAELVKSLVAAGVLESNICVFDCSRPFPEDFKTDIRAHNLAQVVLLGKQDNIAVSDHKIFLSDNKGVIRDGKSNEFYPIPQILIDADYLINLHLVKIHSPGVTGAMKNLFGLSGDVAFYMHHLKDISNTNYIPDLSLNDDIHKRARLNIAEFIFGGHTPDTIDQFTNESFFPGGAPCSLIVSRSPFYHDTVLYNFIKAEYLTCVPVLTRFKIMGPDTWLKNACLKYPSWKYDSAIFIKSKRVNLPPEDLSFKFIDYQSI